MAEQIFNVNCGFFDSINQDRMYSAEDMTRPYKNIISNGVFATSEGTPSNKLQVLSANDGMNIIVKAGDGIFADKWFENPSDLNIAVPANANIVGRYDSVIVQVDKRSTNRTGSIIYREGIAASEPIPPVINEIENVVEYRIANIYVKAGATEIKQENISDLRGSKECPWVTSLIQQVDTSTLYEQYRAAYQKYYDDETKLFNAFMKTLTDELTVYTSIIKYESNFVTTEDDTTEIPINITPFNKDNDVLMVKINKLFATENIDYTISEDGLSIILTKPLIANQSISFLVLQSVVIADAETIVTEFEKLAAAFDNLKIEIENEIKKQYSIKESQIELFTTHIAHNEVSVNKLYKQLNMCTLDFEGNLYFDFDKYNEVGKIPEEFLPAVKNYDGDNSMYFMVNCSGMITILQGKITNDGTIYIYIATGQLGGSPINIRIHASWFTN